MTRHWPRKRAKFIITIVVVVMVMGLSAWLYFEKLAPRFHWQAIMERIRNGEQFFPPIQDKEFAAELRQLRSGAIPVLIEGLKDRSFSVRTAAAYALGAMKPPARKALPHLAEALHDKSPDVRQHAAYAIASYGPDGAEVLDSLIPLLDDDDDFVRMVAMGAISKMGPSGKKAVPALVRFIRKRAYLHRLSILHAKEFRDRAEAAAYQKKGFLVRAIRVLACIGPNAAGAVPELIDALGDVDTGMQVVAAEALGRIGPGAREAIPALEEASKSHDETLRKTATWAIKRIQGS